MLMCFPFNPLNAELNPICHLLALLRGATIVDVSRLRVKGVRDDVVGISTRYGLEGRGIESRWGRDFPHLCRPSLWPIQPPVQWVPGLSRR